jgi:hypothetical protein
MKRIGISIKGINLGMVFKVDLKSILQHSDNKESKKNKTKKNKLESYLICLFFVVLNTITANSNNKILLIKIGRGIEMINNKKGKKRLWLLFNVLSSIKYSLIISLFFIKQI